MIRFIIVMTALLLVSAYAISKGGRPERHAAYALITFQALDMGYHAISDQAWSVTSVDWWQVILDAGLLLAFLRIALGTDRLWTLWITAIQLLATMSHLMRAMRTDAPPFVYAAEGVGPFWVQIAILGLGTWLYRQRRIRISN